MFTVIEVVIALVLVGFVAYPLLKEQLGEEESLDLPEDVEELYRRKEMTYSALKELEFDFRTGKLSEGDFHELDARYRADALEILASIEAREKGITDTSDARRPRAQRKSPGVAAAEPVVSVADASLAEPLSCAACGRVNREDARFCAGCGDELGVDAEVLVDPGFSVETAHEQLTCEECGADARPGHRFCASCGAEVRA